MDKIPEGYKKTEIGLIPEDWMVRSVGEIFKVTRGQVLSVKLVSQVTNSLNRYPVYSSQTVNDGLVGYYDSYLYENAITWTTDGANAGIVNYRRGKFYCTNVCGVLLNSQGFANLFMAHKIGSVSKSYVSYVGNPKLMNNVVDKILVAIPPLEEQIAYSQKMSDIESLIVSTEKLIEKKRNIKQGVMQELLTGKRRLAGFSGDWRKVTLGNIAKFGKGKGLAKKDILSSGKKECIHYGELFTIYGTQIQNIYSKTNIDGDNYLSSDNDVLMPTSDVTPTGLAKASCIRQNGVILGGGILVIRLDDGFDGEFLSMKIRQDKNQILQLVTGTTVFHIYERDMNQFEFSTPEYDEQVAIVHKINDMNDEVDRLTEKLSKLKQIKQGAMQQLLTGKIRLINK